MTTTAPRSARVMALHPASQCFGWVVFEGPFAPHDWGVTYATGDKNASCLQKVEAMLARFQPDTLILETFERRLSSRSDRIARLGRAISALAADRGVDVAIYTRQDIRACFRSVGARSRQEIAEAVVRHIDALRPHLPSKRKSWNGEDYRMTLFSAAALALTHYQLGANTLFDDLSQSLDVDKDQ